MNSILHTTDCPNGLANDWRRGVPTPAARGQRRRCALAMMLVVVVFGPVQAQPTAQAQVNRTTEPANAAAERALRTLGLTPIQGHWRLADEPLLRRRLEQLERLHVEILTAERVLDSLREENRTRWAQVHRKVEALEKRLKSMPTDGKERRQGESQRQALLRTAAPPDKLCESPAVRILLKRRLAWELDATIYWHWSRHTLLRIRDIYPDLHANPAVAGHLETLQAKLASAKPFRDADDILKQIRGQIVVPRTTLYREAGHWRIGLVLNERFPVTMTFAKEDERLLLPASLAKTLGVAPDASRKNLRIQLEKRAFTVEPVIVDSLRIGSRKVEDVAAWVLPPQAADLGAVLGGYAVDDWRVELQPEQMQAFVHAR